MNSMISNCGNAAATAASEGATNRAALPAGSVPLENAPFIRHSGHKPLGALAPSAFPQIGHVSFAAMTDTTETTAEGYNNPDFATRRGWQSDRSRAIRPLWNADWSRPFRIARRHQLSFLVKPEPHHDADRVAFSVGQQDFCANEPILICDDAGGYVLQRGPNCFD